jgi:hypothetical protein
MLNNNDVKEVQLENRRLRQKHEAAVMSLTQALEAAKVRRDEEPDGLEWHGIVASYERSIEVLNK